MRLWTFALRCHPGCLAWPTCLDYSSESPTLSQEVEGLLHVVSLTGFEAPAVRYIRQRLDGLPVVEDTLGNRLSGSVPVVRGASWPVLWMRPAMW